MDQIKNIKTKVKEGLAKLSKAGDPLPANPAPPKKNRKSEFWNALSACNVEKSTKERITARTWPKKSKREKYWSAVSSLFATKSRHERNIADPPGSLIPPTLHPNSTLHLSISMCPSAAELFNDEESNADRPVIDSNQIPPSGLPLILEITNLDKHQAKTDIDIVPTAENADDQDPSIDPIWGPIRSIPAKAIKKLAMQYAPSGAIGVSYLGSKAGQNNSVSLVSYHPGKEKRCVRIPASGWDGKWSQEDKDQLTRSNNILTYLRHNTAIPVPEIFHWNIGLDNAVGAPFTIMSFVDGSSPKNLWFKGVFPEPESTNEDDEDYGFGFKKARDIKGLENKRQKILKSLATALTEFQHLKFDKLGSLSCANGSAGPLEVIPFSNLCYGREEIGYSADSGIDGMAFEHTIESLQVLLEEMKTRTEDDEEILITPDADCSFEAKDESLMDADTKRGLVELYSIVLCCLPIPDRGEKETFVLAPPDFGSQNIKCNEEGEVVAFIDWDLIETRPRLTGWCLPPEWLSADWYRSDRYTWPNRIMTPDDLERYRKDFARYLRDACDDPNETDDWKYATKAPMFDAIITSLIYQDESRMLDTMLSLLQTFLPRVNLRELLRKIGLAQRERRVMGYDMETFFYKKFQILFDNVDHVYDSDDDNDDEESVVVADKTEMVLSDGTEKVKEEPDGETMCVAQDQVTNAKERISDVPADEAQECDVGTDVRRTD
ncbi:hypothetical protein FKW77_010077 [Venturia effusa]|uniref:Aminoglycoside phosphotransferase domain-containing protein n=1 Tax=Venturia effusa TaxID=50376 RepID=A0A517L6C3_9PEZI|nr:hypothetical protein FKW77_010077 [Venturia effusa]